jgi:hypothetical protein
MKQGMCDTLICVIYAPHLTDNYHSYKPVVVKQAKQHGVKDKKHVAI